MSEENTRDEIVRVNLMGEMSIEFQGRILKLRELNSKKVTLLMAYLFYHHKRMIGMTELVDAIWGEADSKNPKGALKNLIYRAREMIRRSWPETEFWQTQVEGYRWNPQLQLELDVDRLNRLEAEIRDSGQYEGIEHWMDLYQHDFLSGCADNYWVNYTRFYYKSQYFNMLKFYYLRLEARGMYERIEQVARRGMEMDSTEELSHIWFIEACLHQHKYQLAEAAYGSALDLMYEGDEAQASDRLQELGSRIRAKRSQSYPGLDVILTEMPKERSGHAVVCDIITFQKLCAVQQRFIKRYGGRLCIVLLNWREREKALMNEQQAAYLTRELEDTLCGCIRGGDVIAHYGDRQFLMLLFDASEAGARIVVERILGRIERKTILRKRISISSEIKEFSDDRKDSAGSSTSGLSE